MKKCIGIVFASLLCSFFSSASCHAKEPIHIGLSIPMTGQFSDYGRDIKEGVELGLKWINDAGGIDGRPIELIVGDSEGSSKKSKRLARKFTADKRIVAEIGDFSSSCSMAAQPIYQRAGMVQFSPTSSHPSFTSASTFSFSVSGTSEGQNIAIARMVAEKLHKKKIAVLYLNNDWGVVEQNFFVEEAKRLGADIVALEGYLKGTTDFTAILRKLRSSDPELLYLCSLYSSGALISKQRQQLGWNNVAVMGAGPLHSQKLLEVGGDAVENLYTSSSFFTKSARPEVRKFVTGYEKRYNRTPNLFAAQSYDTINLLAEAIRQGGTGRRAIRDELAKIRDFSGAIGKISFSQYGDIIKEYLLLQVKNGEFVLCQP